MKKILSLFGVFLLTLFMVACEKTKKADPKFEGTPTAVKTTVEGEILLNAKAASGVVHYAVYTSGEKTALEVKEGKNAVKKASAASHENVKLALTAGETYLVFFVVEDKEEFSNVVKITVKTHKAESPTSVNFGSLAVTTGDEDGTIKVNITTQGKGMISYILVLENADAPTAQEIIAGVNYGTVTVISKASQESFVDYIITDLTPGESYKLYAVVHEGETLSTARNVAVLAKKTVVVVDKGSGTEEDPYVITTVEDLEQIGQGHYAVTDSEWNMDNYYVLGNDIDLTEKYGEGKLSWPVLGADAQGSRFTGHFDGQGFKIIGLYIGIESEAHNYRALFAASEKGSVVKNIIFVNPVVNGVDITDNTSTHATGVVIAYSKSKLENIQVVNGDVRSGSRVGGLVGRIYEEGDMTNIYVNAVVRGDNRVGGIAGVVDVADATPAAITWRNIVFVGEVYGGSDYTGGFSGYVRGLDLANAFMTGYVEGAKNVGGIIGMFQKRGGNNNVIAKVDKVVVKATVVNTSIDTRTGLVIGQKSVSGITTENEHLLVLGTVHHVEGSQVQGDGHETNVHGVLITAEQAKSATFYQELFNDFDANWSIGAGMERPVLKDSLDEGLLLIFSLPILVNDNIKTGDKEYQISIEISSNDTLATIYYIVNESETATKDNISTPASGVTSGSAVSVTDVVTMDKADHNYYVHYFAKSATQESDVVSVLVKSAQETQLTIDVTAVMGTSEGEIDLSALSASHDATIYYKVVLATATAPTAQEIKADNAVVTTEKTTLALSAGEAYKAYFYGEKLSGSNHSEVVVKEVTAKPAASAPFEIVATKLEGTDVRGELRLEITTSHEAVIKYLVKLSSEAAPSNEDVKTTGETYTDVALLPLVGGPGTEYTVYVVATHESEELASNATATTRRDLYNGEIPDARGPFNIYHLEDLEDFASVLDADRRRANIVLHTDIDMSETYGEGLKSWTPYGTNEFKYVGTIVGNGHTITGLYIYYDNPNNNEGVGFIGTADNGFEAHDLKFVNVNITGKFSVGTLAGYTKSKHISNVHVLSGTVTGLGADSRVGGLLGRLNCNSGTDLVEKSSTNVTVTGIKNVGGIVGHVDYSSDTATGTLTIKNVVAYGDIVTSGVAENIGGVVGYLRATLENGVFYGSVSGLKNVGNLVGYTQNRVEHTETLIAPYASITNSYSFSPSDNKLIGSISTSRGPITTENNFQVVETVTDPTKEISLTDVLNTANWGTTVYLDSLIWEVVDNKLVLK